MFICCSVVKLQLHASIHWHTLLLDQVWKLYSLVVEKMCVIAANIMATEAKVVLVEPLLCLLWQGCTESLCIRVEMLHGRCHVRLWLLANALVEQLL